MRSTSGAASLDQAIIVASVLTISGYKGSPVAICSLRPFPKLTHLRHGLAYFCCDAQYRPDAAMW